MMVVRILCVLRYRWLLNPRAHIQVKVFAKKPKSVCGTSSLQKKKKKKKRKKTLYSLLLGFFCVSR